MASIGSFIGRFFGRTASEAAGVAAGITVARPLQPIAQNVENEFWAAFVALGLKRPLDATTSASIVAQRIWDLAQGQNEAALTGRDKADFDSLVNLVMTAPGTAETLELWRRGRIDKGQATHALHKAGLEKQYIDPVLELVGERLDPAMIANAIQQGFIDGAGILAGDTGGTRDITPPAEVVGLTDADGNAVTTEQEAQASGFDVNRLKVLAELSGNPPGPMELLEMWRRGIITETAVERGIREGRTKTKWTSAYKALRRPLLSPATLINLLLRGWIDKTEADNRMALHGYDPAQVTDWFDSAGRPMAPVQAFTAFFRGAPSPKGGTFTKQDFVDAIRRSDIRPEYTEPLWGIRFNYPSLFQLGRATERGTFTPTRARTILHYERYEQQDIDSLVTAWTQGGAASAKAETVAQLRAEYEGLFISEAELRAALAPIYTDPATVDHIVHLGDAARVKTYRDAAVRLVATSYVKHDTDEATARGELGALNISAEATDHLVAVWNIERQITRKELTDAKVRAAFRKLLLSRAEALDELEGRGYTVADANTYLDA